MPCRVAAQLDQLAHSRRIDRQISRCLRLVELVVNGDVPFRLDLLQRAIGRAPHSQNVRTQLHLRMIQNHVPGISDQIRRIVQIKTIGQNNYRDGVGGCFVARNNHSAQFRRPLQQLLKNDRMHLIRNR